MFYGQAVSAWIRFVRVIEVRAEKQVEEPRQPGVLSVQPQHGGTEVRERDDGDARGFQLAKGLHRIGPRLQVQVGVKQPAPVVRCQRQLHGVDGVHQRVFSDSQKVDVLVRDGTEPAVFELARPPAVRQFLSISREDPLDFGDDGIRIEEYQVVEDDCLEPATPECFAVSRGSRRRRGRNRHAGQERRHRQVNPHDHDTAWLTRMLRSAYDPPTRHNPTSGKTQTLDGSPTDKCEYMAPARSKVRPA